MNVSRRTSRTGLTAVIAASLLSLQAHAQSCDFLPSGFERSDGKLYYRTDETSGWIKMPDDGTDLSGRRVTFAYVVSESFDDGRAGVVIFKSGRTRQFDERQTPRDIKLIRLSRPYTNFDNGVCETPPYFLNQYITAQAYDDYHELGITNRESAVLNAFHIKEYAARRGACRSTNSDRADIPPPFGDSRSNRGQFSFNNRIVTRGTGFQLADLFGTAEARASSENLESQRVEMRQYRTKRRDESGCVQFSFNVRGPAAFLHINDLEARISTFRLFRAPERQWRISR